MRIGKSVWLANRTNEINAEIAEYSKPIKIVTRCNYFTVMPSSSGGFMEMLKSGENLYNTWNATANGMYFYGKIKVGDVFWLDGDEPISDVESKYGYGASATAEVKAVSEANYSLSIKLERRQNQMLK